jgi:hypothetical protein
LTLSWRSAISTMWKPEEMKPAAMMIRLVSGHLGTWTSRYWTYATSRYSVLEISILNNKNNLIRYYIWELRITLIYYNIWELRINLIHFCIWELFLDMHFG